MIEHICHIVGVGLVTWGGISMGLRTVCVAAHILAGNKATAQMNVALAFCVIGAMLIAY